MSVEPLNYLGKNLSHTRGPKQTPMNECKLYCPQESLIQNKVEQVAGRTLQSRMEGEVRGRARGNDFAGGENKRNTVRLALRPRIAAIVQAD